MSLCDLLYVASRLHDHRGRNLDRGRSAQHSRSAPVQHCVQPVPRRLRPLRLPDRRRLLTYCRRRRCHGDRFPRLLRRVTSQPVDAYHGASIIIIVIIATTMFMVLSSWPKSFSHYDSSPGSSDECRLSAGWPPTPRPSQSTWGVSPPQIGSYHPHPPSPLLLLLSP